MKPARTDFVVVAVVDVAFVSGCLSLLALSFFRTSRWAASVVLRTNKGVVVAFELLIRVSATCRRLSARVTAAVVLTTVSGADSAKTGDAS
jgi:hypothetical protein